LRVFSAGFPTQNGHRKTYLTCLKGLSSRVKILARVKLKKVGLRQDQRRKNMITRHQQFIEAIQSKRKVWLQHFSAADSAVIDLVCAPMDYGPAMVRPDGVNRYRLWDYTSNNGSNLLALLPEQILELSVLGETFDPSDFGEPPARWSIPRDWGCSERGDLESRLNALDLQ